MQMLLRHLWLVMHPDDPECKHEYSADTCKNFDQVECPSGLIDYVMGKNIPWSEKPWNEVQNVSTKPIY